ncbi:hypothetical protein LCGC14_1848090 [marine sediment metagenome]|uniref:Zinc-finger domain-containing protein n=1 Tax=marine sediment metagenome TaxID=412755 RepID=A0A0F9JAE5_9ZZZZ
MNEPTDQDYRDDRELTHINVLQLEAFARDELSEPERDDLYRHTYHCRRCGDELAGMLLLLEASVDPDTIAALERAKTWYRKRMAGGIR